MCWISQKRRIRWIAGLLLLAYGAAGVLGYGLHELSGCAHHVHQHDSHQHAHSGGFVHIHSHAHGHDCHHHHHEDPVHKTRDGQSPYLTAADECVICQFLAQAQTLSNLEFKTCCWGAVALIDQSVDLSYRDPFCGIGSARAPPLG